jgi:hypothetical protein
MKIVNREVAFTWFRKLLAEGDRGQRKGHESYNGCGFHAEESNSEAGG